MSKSPKIRRRIQSGAAAEIQVLSAGAMGEIVRDLGDAYERTTEIKVRAEFTAGLRLSATAFALVNLSTWLSRRNRVSKSLAHKQARS